MRGAADGPSMDRTKYDDKEIGDKINKLIGRLAAWPMDMRASCSRTQGQNGCSHVFKS